MIFSAPVAQLDRASAFEAGGWGFESLRARHPSPGNLWATWRSGMPLAERAGAAYPESSTVGGGPVALRFPTEAPHAAQRYS
jgi:hypothetical protein